MEELLGLLIGVGAVALSPLVPALRPVAKIAAKGGLMVVETTAMAAAAVGQRWHSAANRNRKALRPEVHTDKMAPVVIAMSDPAATGGAGPEFAADMTVEVSPAV